MIGAGSIENGTASQETDRVWAQSIILQGHDICAKSPQRALQKAVACILEETKWSQHIVK